MADHLVLIEDDGRVRTVRLNRADKLNAFTPALYLDLADALSAAANDERVSVVVLTGNGRAFSAGVDLSVLAAPGGGADLAPAFATMLATLTDFPLPIVAAVNGIATGIGATMLLHTDLIVMGATARVRFPFTAIGLSPEAASSVLLPQRVGPQHAAWMLLSADGIDATTAVATGLAWREAPDAELLAVAREVATTLATHPRASLIETKRLLTAGRRDLVTAALAREHEAMERTSMSPEHRALLARFAPG